MQGICSLRQIIVRGKWEQNRRAYGIGSLGSSCHSLGNLKQEGDIAARREEVKQIAARQKEIEKQIKKRKPKQLRKKKSMQEQLKKLSRSISRLTARTDKILPNQQKGHFDP